MPFQKGKPKTGGRKKGVPIKESVADTLARMNCSPIEGMIRIAQEAETKSDLQNQRLAAHVYGELAQYQHPKRRAIEMSGPEGGAIELNVSAREHILSRIAGLASRK